MDKSLIIFTEQLDAAFDPSTLFPVKKNNISEWVKQKFIKRKQENKNLKKISTINNTSETDYSQMNFKIAN